MSRRADVYTRTVDLAREMWLAEKIAEAAGVKYCGIFAGATDPAARAERARRLILEHKLAARRVFDTKPDTFGDCYQRLYGVPLSQETPLEALSPTQHEIAL